MKFKSTSDLYANFRASSYFSSLNGIRAICAIVVIKEHAGWEVDREPQLLKWGSLGVDMFFIISGFLIVTLLLRERDRTGLIDLKQFYIRRTLRIFPIYYLVIGGLLLLAVATYGHSSKTWDLYKWSFPIFLLYLQDIIPVPMGIMFHTWSLAMEEQFYLIWPTVEKYSRATLVIPVLLVLIAINQLCNFGYLNNVIIAIYGVSQAPSRPIFLITFTPILLGVLAAHAVHNPKVGAIMTNLLKNRWVPLILLIAADLVCEFATQLQGISRLILHMLFCLMLLAIVLNPHGIFSKTLQSSIMSYLGAISYGIYLYHVSLMWGIAKVCEWRGILLTPLEMFLVATPVAIAVAAFSFRYFETPIMSLRLRKRAGNLPAVIH